MILRSRSSFAWLATFALLVPSTVHAALPTGAPVVGAQQALDARTYVGSIQSQSTPAVAFDGTNYSVVWTGAGWWDLAGTRMARVSPAGVVLDPEAPYIDQAATPIQEVAVGGVRSLFWSPGGGESVQQTRVGPTNNELGTTAATTVGSPFAVAASSDHVVVGSFGVAADEVGASVYDATGALVASSASLQATPQNAVAVAVGPQGFLLASTTAITLYGFDLHVVANVTLPSTPIDPVFAATGANDYLVVLEDGTSLSGLRITQAGVLEDAAPIPLASDFDTQIWSLLGMVSGPGTPATAAWNGSAWQLAWVSGEMVQGAPGLFPYQIETAQLAANGAVTVGPVLAALDTSPVAGLGLAGGPAGQTFVTWSGSTYDVLGVRLDATGAALDTQPIIVSTTARAETAPIVTHGQNGYLAVWGSEGKGTLALRFDDTGMPLDATPILVTTAVPQAITGNLYQPYFQVAAGGDEYFLSWYVSGGNYAGVRVGADGTVRDASPISVPGSVVAGGGGQFLASIPGSQYEVALLDASGAAVGAPIALANSTNKTTAAAAWNGSGFDVAWTVWTGVGNNPYSLSTALVATDGTLKALPALPTGSTSGSVFATSTSGGGAIMGWSDGSTLDLELVNGNGALLGGPVPVDGPLATNWPSLIADAPNRTLVTWQSQQGPTGDLTSTSPQAITVDFVSGVAGTPFTLDTPAYAFGSSGASNGVSGSSLFVNTSTTSFFLMPRAAYQSVHVPLATSGGDAGDAGPGGTGDDAGPAGNEDGGVDAGSGERTDAGPVETSDGGASNGDSSSSSSSGCGCTSATSSGGPGSLAFAVLVAGALVRRRRVPGAA